MALVAARRRTWQVVVGSTVASKKDGNECRTYRDREGRDEAGLEDVEQSTYRTARTVVVTSRQKTVNTALTCDLLVSKVAHQ